MLHDHGAPTAAPAVPAEPYSVVSSDDEFEDEESAFSSPNASGQATLRTSSSPPDPNDSAGGSSSSATPTREDGGDGGGDRAGGGHDDADGALSSGGGSVAEGPSPCSSTLTPSVLKLLMVPKPGVPEVDALSAELHLSERAGPPAARNLLHALSKESLDIMRAERIARRMARSEQEQQEQQQPQQQGVSIIGPVRAVGFDEGPTTSHGTKPRKAKSSRREERVFMPILATRPAATTPTRAAVASDPLLQA